MCLFVCLPVCVCVCVCVCLSKSLCCHFGYIRAELNQNPTKKFQIWLGSSVQLWWVQSHTHTLRVVVGTLSKREMPARHSNPKPKIDLQRERERDIEEGVKRKQVRFMV